MALASVQQFALAAFVDIARLIDRPRSGSVLKFTDIPEAEILPYFANQAQPGTKSSSKNNKFHT